MVQIITGTSSKPMASEQLKKFFRDNAALDGILYIGYPIIGTSTGAFSIDAIWLSQKKGAVIFDLVEGINAGTYQNRQDDCYNKLEAKLRGYRELVDRRKLCVEITAVTFAPALNSVPDDADYPICNAQSLGDFLNGIDWEQGEVLYGRLVSVLQAISNIRKPKRRREVRDEKSRGAKLRTLEESIANLDNTQSRAVIETVEGVQRIRGLAGSGKTIVLALKAAYLHVQHPDWKIAVTFNTRSLKGQFKKLINNFYIEQTGEEPDWEYLRILNAWGAPGSEERSGLYFEFCLKNKLDYMDYETAREHFGREKAFDSVCNLAIGAVKTPQPDYDAILVDEAQDFSPSFLNLCYRFLKEPKRLVYAYDELQNLSSQSLPAPEEIFGVNDDGSPKVKFLSEDDQAPQQDIILSKCYRNSRPALTTAHALGFGIYRKPQNGEASGLVQIFEDNHLWEEVGYKVTEGVLSEGKRVVLSRTWETSPKFLEEHSSIDDLIVFRDFASEEEQSIWVATQIEKNLKEDELRYDDIIVINPDPLKTRKAAASIRKQLYLRGIASHITGVDTLPDVFFSEEQESIAVSGIYRAKGNEAAMVYVINAQDCFSSLFETAKVRNELFTAITRSKAWVRVVGVGDNMRKLAEEYEEVKKHKFSLDFIYPTKEQKRRLKIVNRDKSLTEKEKVRKGKQNIESLMEDLEGGEIYIEDLGPETAERLKKILESYEKGKK